MNRLAYMSHEALSSIPSELVADLQSVFSSNETLRPTSLGFTSSSLFQDDTRLRDICFLYHMLERDNIQNSEFLKVLSEMWKDFDSRVLRYKVFPPLCAELRNLVMQPNILPMVLTIVESQDKNDFDLSMLPTLVPVLNTASGDALLLLVKHVELIIEKRITIDKIWMMSGLRKITNHLPVFSEKEYINLDGVEVFFKDSEEHHITKRREAQPVAMNTFELISISNGLNLGKLFDEQELVMSRIQKSNKVHIQIPN